MNIECVHPNPVEILHGKRVCPDCGLVTVDGNIWYDDGGDERRLTYGPAKGGFTPSWRI